jgi:hypothetical protein
VSWHSLSDPLDRVALPFRRLLKVTVVGLPQSTTQFLSIFNDDLIVIGTAFVSILFTLLVLVQFRILTPRRYVSQVQSFCAESADAVLSEADSLESRPAGLHVL